MALTGLDSSGAGYDRWQVGTSATDVDFVNENTRLKDSESGGDGLAEHDKRLPSQR